MKLASLKGGRDGRLVIVSRDLTSCVEIPHIAATMQELLDDWESKAPAAEKVFNELNEGRIERAQAFDAAACHSPLPRAYQWADGSAYLNHVELVRKARGAEIPASFYEDPLMYQGGRIASLGPAIPSSLRLRAGASIWRPR